MSKSTNAKSDITGSLDEKFVMCHSKSDVTESLEKKCFNLRTPNMMLLGAEMKNLSVDVGQI